MQRCGLKFMLKNFPQFVFQWPEFVFQWPASWYILSVYTQMGTTTNLLVQVSIFHQEVQLFYQEVLSSLCRSVVVSMHVQRSGLENYAKWRHLPLKPKTYTHIRFYALKYRVKLKQKRTLLHICRGSLYLEAQWGRLGPFIF